MCYVALLILAIFYIKKQAFCSSSALYHEEDIKDRHETFTVYSLLWSFRQRNWIRLRAKRKSSCQILVLLCGDVETCPGPVTRCSSCNKSVRNSQSRISCLLCQKDFHLRYFGSTEEASYSFCSHYNETGQEREQEQTQSTAGISTIRHSRTKEVAVKEGPNNFTPKNQRLVRNETENLSYFGCFQKYWHFFC